jgi:D-xylose transport system substrate-binding protein
MKKKVFTMITMALISMVLFSCSSKRNPEIGLLMGTLQLERWQKDTSHFVTYAKENGARVIVQNANNNQGTQIQQAEKLLNQGVDVLVVVPVDQNISAEIVRMAHDRGVKVIAYDRLIRQCDLDYYVSFDNVKIGELQAGYITNIQPKGKYALIGGPTSDNNSIMLRLGQINVLSPYIERGDIEIVYDNFAYSWDKESGKLEMEKCLGNNQEIDAVIAANDALAEGIAESIEENGLKKNVLLTGQDAELKACQRIIQGKQTMTVYKPVRRLAQVATEVACKFACDEEVSTVNQTTIFNGNAMVPSILLEPVSVHRQNIQLTVLMDEYQNEEKIFR